MDHTPGFNATDAEPVPNFVFDQSIAANYRCRAGVVHNVVPHW
jgi:hypothetical protein